MISSSLMRLASDTVRDPMPLRAVMPDDWKSSEEAWRGALLEVTEPSELIDTEFVMWFSFHVGLRYGSQG